MQFVKPDVQTICVGIAMSMGALLLAGGAKGKRMALPNAKIVHLTRHPMAACYAMYKTLFKDGYPFSYDLQEIARFSHRPGP